MGTIELARGAAERGATSQLAELWQSALPTPIEIRRGRRRLHAKATVTLLGAALAYWLLVVADTSWWVRVLAAAVLILTLITTATGIMHDANHGSFSRFRWLNRLAACSADALGASSWLWRFKHNQLHHGNTNVEGIDSDLAQEPFARLAPGQTWRRWHRWQHVYLWFLYGFFPLKNLLFGDLRNLTTNNVGGQQLSRRPSAAITARMILGKVVHLGWAVVVPLLLNPWQHVVAFYLVSSWLVGLALAIIFQLAHCVDGATFSTSTDWKRNEGFLEHQMRTTVDIASPMPVVGHLFRWLAGGLDHQVEHHMAPRLPHTVYPVVARRFHLLCSEAGIAVRSHITVWAALRSHTRWLVEMGQPPIAA